MGWNSTVIILNDCLREISKDIDFGSKLADAIMNLPGGDRRLHMTEVSAGCCIGAAAAIETHHADGYSLVCVGGNMGKVLGHISYMPDVNDPEDVVKAMKCFLREKGYSVRKTA